MTTLSCSGDDRPKKGGWAPGNYFGTCHRCGNDYIGDKRAINCSNCEYGTKRRYRYNWKLKCWEYQL